MAQSARNELPLFVRLVFERREGGWEKGGGGGGECSCALHIHDKVYLLADIHYSVSMLVL